MKCKRNVTLTIIAICLITAAAHAQGRILVLRFRVPFPFTVKNTTFAAGEYEMTQPGQFVIALRNVQNQASAFEHVLPASSKKEADRRPRAVFHRYGGAYFLATISDGSSQATYDLDRSNKEKVLADKIPARQQEVVSVLTNGTVVTDVGPE